MADPSEVGFKTVLYMRVEVNPGQTKEVTADAMIKLADRMDISVETRHEGIHMRVRPGQTIEQVLVEYASMQSWCKLLEEKYGKRPE
jgi:hypothetical protein